MTATPKANNDAFNLERFATAQKPIFKAALDELKAGRKRTHWMWFIFPQLRGLGSSPTAQFYGIASLAEARAYLTHPVLGPRLVACTEAVLATKGKSLQEIFGSPDDIKFRSSMTLFALASNDDGSLFRRALDAHCARRMDDRTVDLLNA